MDGWRVVRAVMPGGCEHDPPPLPVTTPIYLRPPVAPVVFYQCIDLVANATGSHITRYVPNEINKKNQKSDYSVNPNPSSPHLGIT